MKWNRQMLQRKGPFCGWGKIERALNDVSALKCSAIFDSLIYGGVGVGEAEKSFGKDKGFMTIAFSLGNENKPFLKKRSSLQTLQ
ncbi:hypothetical protein [Bacillus sp. Hm123]|uniref:hypothetical protein n=1 Tax=Bacillus sp. Hm123 TaxID=3450745 RepID=UPI003F437B64